MKSETDALKQHRIASVETPWMIVEEAAKYLRCSERLVREELANDRIPHAMFAGKALFHPSSLDAWLFARQTGGGERLRPGEKTMNEADMERLVRDYPDEFFDEKLTLVSQQEVFHAGITDLIFRDTRGDLLLVELKRGVLRREHVAQIFDYLEEVENRYSNNVELMVIANVVPPQRRTKLERLGVSFKEIPEARFREVAARHGVVIAEPRPTSDGGREGSGTATRGERMAIEDDCPRDRVAALVGELVAYGERFVTGLGRNLKQDLENSDYGWLSDRVYAQLSRWCHPNRHTDREQWVMPRAHELSRCLFGRVIERSSHPSYAR